MRRRDFLRLAAAWPAALSAQEPARRATAVIWLWMGGGMRAEDTWDPDVNGPPAIPTAVPGVEISSLLPRCAARMTRLAIVRTMAVESRHPALAAEELRTGWVPYPRVSFAPIGTILAWKSGKTGFRKYVALDVPGIPSLPAFAEEDRPFHVKDVERPLSWTPAKAPEPGLLDDLNAAWARRHPGAQAPRTIRLPVEAFDVAGEPAALRGDYGPGFGRRCLVARRLVEAGCPFVEVGLNGWGGGDRAKLCAELDAGMSTLVQDLEQRGRLMDTVVVCAGEPSPKGTWSAVLGGGPIRGGVVFGGRPVFPPLFLSTIYRACGIPQGRYHSDGHTWSYVKRWPTPIAELF